MGTRERGQGIRHWLATARAALAPCRRRADRFASPGGKESRSSAPSVAHRRRARSPLIAWRIDRHCAGIDGWWAGGVHQRAGELCSPSAEGLRRGGARTRHRTVHASGGRVSVPWSQKAPAPGAWFSVEGPNGAIHQHATLGSEAASGIGDLQGVTGSWSRTAGDWI